MKNGCVKVYKNSNQPRKKILFLGYDREKTKLIDLLLSEDCEVHNAAEMVCKFDYDLIFCFGYRQIFKPSALAKISCPIINLHISYLPYNRGAHPNFWSFYENTPKGVTIHLIDANIDTGPILYQAPVLFDDKELTFREAYTILICKIETLFQKNMSDILDFRWKEKLQKGTGTFHYSKDLPKQFLGWDENIGTEIDRLKKIAGDSND